MEFDLQILFGLHVTWCAQLYSLAGPRTRHPHPRIWAHIRGRYWSAKIDGISWWPPGCRTITFCIGCAELCVTILKCPKNLFFQDFWFWGYFEINRKAPRPSIISIWSELLLKGTLYVPGRSFENPPLYMYSMLYNNGHTGTCPTAQCCGSRSGRIPDFLTRSNQDQE